LFFFVLNEAGIFDSNDIIPPDTTPSFNVNGPPPGTQQNEVLLNSKPISLEDKLQNGLIKAGWKPNAAHTVVALNTEWFKILQQDSPQDLEKQIYLLKKLGNRQYQDLMPLFQAHPETAALLVVADDPVLMKSLLKWDECYGIIMGLFAQHAAPEDAAALANALEHHRLRICRLIIRGLIGTQALFIFPRDNPGAQEYDIWLAEVLDDALKKSDDDELGSLINLLFEQGASIRGKMIDDAQFERVCVWQSL
jgi:hypothetical protein